MPQADEPARVRPLVERVSLATLHAGLKDQPAVLIGGARGVGKTTLAQQVAASTFDLSNEAAYSQLDSVAETRLREAPKPVLIDEWQMLPRVAWTVKHLIDTEGQRGFILAGSVPPDVEDFDQFPLTNRCAIMELTPLSVSERRGRPNPQFLDRLFRSDPPTDIERLEAGDYLRLIVESGYPGLSGLNDERQRRALNNLARTVVARDVPIAYPELRSDVSRGNLRRFLRTCAQLSSTTSTLKTMADLSRVGEKAARRYQAALTDTHLLHNIEVWRPQATAAPKVSTKQFVIEAALIPVLGRKSADATLRDPDLLGRSVETFVFAQLAAIASWETHECELMTYDYPDPKKGGGSEPAFPYGGIDFLLESVETSAMVAIEVKARDHFRRDDVARMTALRNALDADDDGDAFALPFAAGLALCCGDIPVMEVDDRIWAAPLSILWARD